MQQRKRGVIALALEAFAFEEASDGQANREKERVFYAQLLDKSVLAQASHVEHHDQWELRIDLTEDNFQAGRFRVRATTQPGNDVPEYVLTSKTKFENGDEEEVPTPSSQAQFEQFKRMSPRGMIKTRYSFDIPGRKDKWEVDTFLDPQTRRMSDWVKIDLEFNDPNIQTVPAFPAGLLVESSIISNLTGTDEAKAKIRELYEKLFITKNVYRHKANTGAEPLHPPEAAAKPADPEVTAPADEPGTLKPELTPVEPAL